MLTWCVEYHFVCSMKRSNHLIIESLKRDLGRFWKGHDVQRKALVPSTRVAQPVAHSAHSPVDAGSSQGA
jgi:hypothetical protein